jgi:hypothetical protein
MKTTKKWSKMLLAGMAAMVLAFGMMMTGCASTPEGFFTAPKVTMSNVNGNSVKIGAATAKVWLGIFAGSAVSSEDIEVNTGDNQSADTKKQPVLRGSFSYPPIAEAANNGDIKKIATVEYYKKPGILFLWTDYTTIVTGE